MTRRKRCAGNLDGAAEWAQLRQWDTSVILHASVTLMERGKSTRVSLRWMSAKMDVVRNGSEWPIRILYGKSKYYSESGQNEA